MSKNTLLLSVAILKERTGIHTNIDEKLLYPEIKAAQDLYIEPILGTPLYNKIISDIESTGTTTGYYKTLLDTYIIDTLYNYVLASLPDVLSFQFWNKGVVRKTGGDTETPSMAELIDYGQKFFKRAESYGQRTINYLKQTANSTILPEYLQRNFNLDNVYPANSVYSIPIFLDDRPDYLHMDRNNCNCNEYKSE